MHYIRILKISAVIALQIERSTKYCAALTPGHPSPDWLKRPNQIAKVPGPASSHLHYESHSQVRAKRAAKMLGFNNGSRILGDSGCATELCAYAKEDKIRFPSHLCKLHCEYSERMPCYLKRQHARLSPDRMGQTQEAAATRWGVFASSLSANGLDSNLSA